MTLTCGPTGSTAQQTVDVINKNTIDTSKNATDIAANAQCCIKNITDTATNTQCCVKNTTDIAALSAGQNLKGNFTPASALEYPATPTNGDTWIIDGLTTPYLFTGGDLSGTTLTNQDKMTYTPGGWTYYTYATPGVSGVADVELLSDLADVDSTKFKTAIVREAGVGGVFNHTGAADDGGVNISGWTRQFSGAVNVKWFGAKGDGSVSDSPAITLALSALKQYGAVGAGVGSYSAQTLFIPAGKYRLDTTISVNHYLTIQGEDSILYSDNDIILVDIAGYANKIDGIIFDGGKNHVAVIGPNLDTMQLILNNVEFKNCSDTCVLHDIERHHGGGSSTPRTGFSMQQIISNFKSHSSPLGRFSCDGIMITDGWISFNPNRTSSDDVFCIEHQGPLTFDKVLGVSVSNSTGDQFWFKSGLNLINSAELHILNSRLGEGGSAILYAYNSKYVEFKNSAIFGRPGNLYPYMEVYNQIPSINIENCEGWADSLGIMIDSVSIPSIFDYTKTVGIGDLSIRFNGNKGGQRESMVVHSTRAEYSSQGLNRPLVNGELSQFFQEDLQFSNTVSKNYWTNGSYSLAQGGWTNAQSVNTDGGANISFSGYSLGTRVANADGGIFSKYQTLDVSGLEKGEYVVSMFVLSTATTAFGIAINTEVLAKKYINTSGEYVRISASYYHDGIATSLTLIYTVESIPNGETISVGLWSLTKGNALQPYVFPHSEDVLSYTTEVLYGTSAPSSGYYKRGDIVYNTEPTAGGNVGWICVSGTSASLGTWKTFGTIEA